MAKEITNTAASVHARLLNQARAGSRSFNDLLQLYAMERFLHRLSRTKHADRFVLKGALLMRAWDTTMFRTTRDIDLLARASNEVAVLEGVVREACTASPTALTTEFGSIADKRTQWRVFRKRFGTTNCPEEFEAVVQALRAFLAPVIAAARSGNATRLRWDPARGWVGP
jgi:hypothetical protein